MNCAQCDVTIETDPPPIVLADLDDGREPAITGPIAFCSSEHARAFAAQRYGVELAMVSEPLATSDDPFRGEDA